MPAAAGAWLIAGAGRAAMTIVPSPDNPRPSGEVFFSLRATLRTPGEIGVTRAFGVSLAATPDSATVFGPRFKCQISKPAAMRAAAIKIIRGVDMAISPCQSAARSPSPDRRQAAPLTNTLYQVKRRGLAA